MPAHSERRSRYDPLVVWLQTLPAEQARAELTLAENEAILGAPLPAGAWSTTTTFWASGTVAPVAWHALGFRPRLNRLARAVTFQRVTP